MEQPLGHTRTGAGTEQQGVAEAAPPEQEEARFATSGDTKGKGTSGYKNGKALSPEGLHSGNT